MHDVFQILAYPLPALLMVGMLVCVHELGHFAVARLCGVRVAVVSLGFGRGWIGHTDRRGTLWRVGRLPFGGYVRMAADEAGNGRPFTESPLAVRSAITLAGPLANFAFAVLAFTIVFLVWGQHVRQPVVTAVVPGSPAAAAGIQPGDRLVAVDGRGIEGFEDVVHVIQRHPGDAVTIRLETAEGQRTVVVTPQLVSVSTDGGQPEQVARIGIQDGLADAYVHRTPVEAVKEACGAVYDNLAMSLAGIRQLAEGKRPTGQVRGVATLVQASHATVRHGPEALLWMAGLLSVGIGLFNLLPIPVLDGGHLVFLALEAAMGRPPTPRFIATASQLGLGLLLLLALWGARNDLLHALG
jgi:regulator of sigma E protease